MRKLILAVLVFCSCTLSARQLSVAEAMDRFKAGAADARSSFAADEQLLCYTAEQDGYNLMYVVNRGDGRGFYILSADDCAPAVLGYSDKGDFDYLSIPPQMKWWLSLYSKSILNAILEGTALPEPQTEGSAVSPMLTCTWGQDAPYNALCTDMGYLSVTGCVATAMAQIMYFHKHPAKGSGVCSYEYEGTTITSRLVDHEYQWNLMQDSYSKSDTGETADAVALLMRDCGVSVNMAYSAKESGTSAYYVAPALYSNFGYDKGVQVFQRIFYSDEQWETMIIDELSAGRPILYTGRSNEGGHAFVMDGYDGNGYYHINWGWRGAYDTYFLVTGQNALNPEGTGIGGGSVGEAFDQDQAMILGIQPDAGTTACTATLCAPSGITASVDPSTTNKIDLTIGCYNFGVCNITNLSLGVKFRRKSTGTVSTMEIGSMGTLKVMYGGQINYTLMCDNLDDDEYEFYSVYTTSTGHSKKWKQITLPYGWVLPNVRVQNHVATVIEPGHVTGIDDIFYKAADSGNSNAIFDITGRKVNDTNRPGIYIRNGQKVIIP